MLLIILVGSFIAFVSLNLVKNDGLMLKTAFAVARLVQLVRLVRLAMVNLGNLFMCKLLQSEFQKTPLYFLIIDLYFCLLMKISQHSLM